LKSKWCLVLEKQSHLFLKAKSSLFDVEGTSCCSEGGSRELIKPEKQANLDKTVMKWCIEQHFRTSTFTVRKDCFALKW
jgi:Holliday junction resolvase-like predicted endonuclease